ncbi:MAG: PSD1 domain-containing protein [Planctomycetaceae bacterium]|nr:PSD1 domain-containing protein [Planctomycetaceae bacterium]
MLLCLASLLLQGVTAFAEDAATDFFEAKIRPLLIEKCGECHTGSKSSGGLSLSSREALVTGGENGSAINAENPQASLLLQAVRRSDDLAMPPEEELSKSEVALLEEWIKLGAPWPANIPVVSPSEERARNHWAFQPVTKPDVPAVQNTSWCRNPIDNFVLAKLEANNLGPSQQADRRTLARRVGYTVTGLPLSVERIESFVNSTDEQAYEKLVDELLDSPQYGEQWARHWLDVARYSDTKGYVYAREERFWVHAWVYRDWVVEALNRDLPYDDFLRLQIAADQVDGHDQSDLAAMGFLTLGRRFLGVPWDIIDDRIDTVCRGTLGLTVACARCHDHKYDPIPTADYYSLYGVFASSEEELVRLHSDDASEGFDAELAKRQAELDQQLTAARDESSERARSRVTDYLQSQRELEKYPAQGFDQVFSKTDLLPAFVRRWQAWLHRSQVEGEPVFAAWHAYREFEGEQFAEQAESVTRQLQELSPDKLNPLVREIFASPPASFDEVVTKYGDLLKQIDEQWKQSQTVAEGEEKPGSLPTPEAEQVRGVLYGPDAPSQVPNQPMVHVETFFDTDTINALWKVQGEVDRWIIQSGEAVAHAVTLRDAEVPSEPQILRRGNPVNFGDDVPRQFLKVVSGDVRKPFSQGSGRLELAEAIASPNNPLTARVIVNRVWTQHFGEGLVRTPSDFGLRAQPPSHPELLDWLATWFVENDWSLKKLHRLILLSNTFQQSSVATQDAEMQVRARKLDPENRLLWKMNRHRLTFEEFRDSLLSAAGSLDRTVGGKPRELFTAPYPTRRTLYGLIDRQYLPSTLRVFDFANPDLHIPQRSETTVPQQSLFLLNHPLMLEQVRKLAERPEGSTSPEQLMQNLFRRTLGRNPTETELSEALQFVELAEQTPQATPRETAKDWQYGFGTVNEAEGKTTAFEPLPHFTGTAWQGGAAWPDAKLGWVQLTATGGHPGNDHAHMAIRRWVAPRKVTIQIKSTLINEPAAGDGVKAYLVSSRAGVLKSEHSHQQPTELNVESIEVEAGETIDFVIDIHEVLNSDQFLWEIALAEQNGESVWNSQLDFPVDTVQQLNGWEQLAQALLCTNEFLFVD